MSHRYTRLVEVRDLGPEHVGTLISYDGDEPTLFGGWRRLTDEGRGVITLDGREHEAWDFDYVYLPRPEDA